MASCPDQPSEVLLWAPDGYLYRLEDDWVQVDDLNWYCDVPTTLGVCWRARGGEAMLQLVKVAEDNNNPYLALAWKRVW